MAILIDGQHQARVLRHHVAAAVTQLQQLHGNRPGLAVIQVGDHAPSRIYVKRKGEQTREVSMHSVEHHLPATTPQSDLLAHIAACNADPAIHGILVQLPLPPALDTHAVIAAIDPDKDVDGFHPVNVGRLWSGLPGLVPCTPLGCMRLLRRLGDLRGKRTLVLGRSNIVGKPVAGLLLQADCTVELAHSHTRDLPALCRQADILVAALGKPEFVRGDWLKPGSWVIDVGINRVTDSAGSRLVGDVAFDEAAAVAAAITPVPGGVGPMTIACLLANTVAAFCAQQGVDNPLPALEAAVETAP